MGDTAIVWMCVLVGVLGLAVAGGIAWFGCVVFKRRVTDRLFERPFLEELFHRWAHSDPSSLDVPRHLAESYAEYLQRRNEFWTAYGQVLLAVLIVTVLAILLLTDAISAEAGLPILSGISGFAIAKGVSGARTINVPQERQRG